MKHHESAIKRSVEASVITGSYVRLASTLRSRETMFLPSVLPAVEKLKRVYFSNKSLNWTRLVVPVASAEHAKRDAHLCAFARSASPFSSIR